MDTRFADLESELCRIPEVSAARVVVDTGGRPTEVHILASPGKHAKQVVRDIQSVAMASFGLDLDRRLISVVQLEGQQQQPAVAAINGGNGDRRQPVSDEGVGTDPVATALHRPDVVADGERVVVESVVTVRSGFTCLGEVTLARAGDRVKGRAEGTVASSAVLRVVAQATLDALRQLEPATARADVEATTVVRLGERSVAMVTIVVVRPPYEEVMAGAAVVRSAGEHDAVARAVLHALNRRLPRLP